MTRAIMLGDRRASEWIRLVLLSIAPLLAVLAFAGDAGAVPAFAAQTGQACQTCHVGGFGPQLTPYGRNFKLNGYTLRSGAINVPLAAMIEDGYVHTGKRQPEPPAPGFHDNDNFALDQLSLFLAGGVGSHLGGFVQGTYDGVAKAWSWDNLDLRAVTKLAVGGADVVLGASFNNSPTVQDPWNTLPAWSFPYSSSDQAPSPAAAPLISGALAQETLGLTAYAWINSELYLEAGAYGSPSRHFLSSLGADPTSPGDIDGIAPYARAAIQKSVGPHTLEAGLFFLQAKIFPRGDHSAGVADSFRDLGFDASDHVSLANGDVVTLNLRYVHERQSLDASQALGLAANRRNTLRDLRVDVSYYWRNTIGGTVQVFDTSGSADPTLYADNRTFKPQSTGVMFQIDGTPFGGASQPHRRINLRAGLQYILYTRFNGAHADFDGVGTKASDENALRVFTWFAF